MSRTTDLADLGTWQDYVRQPIMFTEAVRGGPLVWPAGATHLHGDPLGPVRHAHDGAAEYYFVLSGACLVEIAGEERVATAGDLVYIPADAPHNLLHEVGGADAWTYIMVAPNFANNKWRTSGYLANEESPRMTVTRPLDGDNSASKNPFPADVILVERGESLTRISSTAELVYLVAEGQCHTRVGPCRAISARAIRYTSCGISSMRSLLLPNGRAFSASRVHSYRSLGLSSDPVANNISTDLRGNGAYAQG